MIESNIITSIRLTQGDQLTAIVVTASWFHNSCKYESFWKELKSKVLDKAQVKSFGGIFV